jgi:ABC-2 type transport system ATP-binding protein
MTQTQAETRTDTQDQARQSVVRAVGLTKTFRDFWLREKVTAVRELDMAVRPGEIYGLLGPNGSGKSTTLKMVLGLMHPTKGRVAVFGAPPTDVATKARIGFLPEESYLYPFLDAHETLDYYGRLFHQDRAERKRRIEMLLDMVGLSGAAYRRVGEYSKGMQRRIGMAQALINDPDLLILDEPTSGMDPLAARQFKDLIGELSRRGKTVILSSHLLADMEDVCDRVGILFSGQLRAEGTLDELLARSSMTQITTEALDEETSEALSRLLSERGKQLLQMDTPRDRLESLFLRIIREARRRPARAGGFVDTGQVAEFLRAEAEGTAEGQRLIEELVSGEEPAEPEPAEAAEAAQPARPEPDRDVLGNLLAEKEEAGTAKTGPPGEQTPPPPRPKSPQADRGLIDSLVDQPDQPPPAEEKDRPTRSKNSDDA